MRLDKFLKVSRLIKRRTVANEACDAGRVLVNGKTAKAAATIGFSSTTLTERTVEVDPTVFNGVKTVYFVFTDGTNIYFDNWQFSESLPDAVAVPAAATKAPDATYRLDGTPVSRTAQPRGLIIERVAGKTRKRIVK